MMLVTLRLLLALEKAHDLQLDRSFLAPTPMSGCSEKTGDGRVATAAEMPKSDEPLPVAAESPRPGRVEGLHGRRVRRRLSSEGPWRSGTCGISTASCRRASKA